MQFAAELRNIVLRLNRVQDSFRQLQPPIELVALARASLRANTQRARAGSIAAAVIDRARNPATASTPGAAPSTRGRGPAHAREALRGARRLNAQAGCIGLTEQPTFCVTCAESAHRPWSDTQQLDARFALHAQIILKLHHSNHSATARTQLGPSPLDLLRWTCSRENSGSRDNTGGTRKEERCSERALSGAPGVHAEPARGPACGGSASEPGAARVARQHRKKHRQAIRASGCGVAASQRSAASSSLAVCGWQRRGGSMCGGPGSKKRLLMVEYSDKQPRPSVPAQLRPSSIWIFLRSSFAVRRGD
jgi:hypothetical protein